MQEVFCPMFYISCKNGPNLCRGQKQLLFLKKRQIFFPFRTHIIAVRSTHINIVFSGKINKVYSVDKLGLLIQRDEKSVGENIKQNLYGGKVCSF